MMIDDDFLENEIFNLVSRQSAALSTATYYTIPPEFGGKWEMECLILTLDFLCLPLCVGDTIKCCIFLFPYKFEETLTSCMSYGRELTQIWLIFIFLSTET